MRYACLLLCLSTAGIASAQSKTEVDNQWVHVTRLKLAPHAKTKLTPRKAAVWVYLTDAQLRITTTAITRTAGHRGGDVGWSDAVEESEENISNQPFEAVITELKGPPSGGAQPSVTLDPVKLDRIHHLVPMENDRVRVLRTLLEPHLKSPMHEHPHYVVVYLTELHTTMELGNGKSVDNPRHPGDVAWRDFMKHETENIGDRLAVEIQIEIK